MRSRSAALSIPSASSAIVASADAVEAYWRLKTNIDSGMFEAVQLAAVAALRNGAATSKAMSAIYQRRRDLVCGALREIGVEVEPPKGTIYVWAPVPEGYTSASYCELVLEESGVVISPGGAYGKSGEGWFRISLTVPDDRLAEAVERMRSSLGG
jgi:LL-diaminopimelate aminotransferase